MAGLMARMLMSNSAGLYPKMGNGTPTTRKRRASKKRGATKVRSAKRKTNKRARLVKGSAAAKAYMAKIRRKRR
jgi:hypothetical protein